MLSHWMAWKQSKSKPSSVGQADVRSLPGWRVNFAQMRPTGGRRRAEAERMVRRSGAEQSRAEEIVADQILHVSFGGWPAACSRPRRTRAAAATIRDRDRDATTTTNHGARPGDAISVGAFSRARLPSTELLPRCGPLDPGCCCHRPTMRLSARRGPRPTHTHRRSAATLCALVHCQSVTGVNQLSCEPNRRTPRLFLFFFFIKKKTRNK